MGELLMHIVFSNSNFFTLESIHTAYNILYAVYYI
jgi:hypothetical protein